MSSAVSASFRLGLVIGLPIFSWAFMLIAGILPFLQPLLHLYLLPYIHLSAFFLAWVAVAASILLDRLRGHWPTRTHRSPWLTATIALFSPLWLLGFVLMANLPGTVGLAFLLLYPAAFATPLAVIVLVGAALTGRLWGRRPRFS